MSTQHIRNFCIIAHIDHGKSTLADRLLEYTGAVSERDAKKQFLDNMDIERERGITIKAQTVTLEYTAKNGQNYQLNLIDTPGHVDFTYEVSRSIAACEGALLVVDAAQGVEAQTLANVYMAAEQDLDIIPVLNKIDLPSAEPERVCDEIEEVIGIDASEAVHVSAKSGIGIEDLLEAIVERISPPPPQETDQLRALIFDSWFDPYLGVVALFRIFSGTMRSSDKIRFLATKKDYQLTMLGKHRPHKEEHSSIGEGEVAFLAASIKNIADTKIGDTITLAAPPHPEPLRGYAESKPMVFCGVYPVDSADYPLLQEALDKLSLNDASIAFEPETSAALGFGYRCGFLGMLHMEITQERLEREFNLTLIATAPTVIYRVHTKKQEVLEIENPAQLPDPMLIEYIEEPYIKGVVYTPEEYVGAVMKLALDKRGEQEGMEYIGDKRVSLTYQFPLNEIVIDFFDKIKSVTKGYASFDYELSGYRKSKLIRMDILLNGEMVDALSMIVFRDKAQVRGRDLTKKMKELIPRQMFEIAIQAAIGGKIISRETISAMRKNVTAKCYGGDISRKRKLLEKQKAGKKRMKQFGSVEVPQEAFMAVLKLNE